MIATAASEVVSLYFIIVLAAICITLIFMGNQGEDDE
jgi:hypothetical protein